MTRMVRRHPATSEPVGEVARKASPPPDVAAGTNHRAAVTATMTSPMIEARELKRAMMYLTEDDKIWIQEQLEHLETRLLTEFHIDAMENERDVIACIDMAIEACERKLRKMRKLRAITGEPTKPVRQGYKPSNARLSAREQLVEALEQA